MYDFIAFAKRLGAEYLPPTLLQDDFQSPIPVSQVRAVLMNDPSTLSSILAKEFGILAYV